MNRLIESLLAVIYPPTCPCCDRVMVSGERCMCLSCRISFPLTGFHLSPADNEMRSKLNGTVPIDKATAYFYYNKFSPHTSLIHEAKYRGRPRLARDLAREYASILLPGGFFDNIDALVPVPLSFLKLCRRGYNQSAWIARGISRETSIPVIDALKARNHHSQTRLGADDRRRNASGIFTVREHALTPFSHVLLIDDICTTGSTLYACAQAIHTRYPAIKISALTLASTQLT